MSSKITWPELPVITKDDPQADVKLELYKAELEKIKTDYQTGLDQEKNHQTEIQEQQKRDYANYYTQIQAIHTGYIEVAKGSIDRSIQRADFLEKVSAAIASVYTGVLALSFAVDKGTPLAVTGIIPAIFFGFSFFLSAVYISFVTQTPDVKMEKSDGTLTGSVESQRKSFILWNKATVMRRISFMQASIVSLGVGILLLPIPYLHFSDKTLWLLMGIGLGLIVLIPLVVFLVTKLAERKKAPPDNGNIPSLPMIPAIPENMKPE
jgi:hypothetical protein